MMSEVTLYQDRASAGEALAVEVANTLAGGDLPVRVYALPRGGIPIALPIAQRLNCPLEVLASKKISLPPHSELALGAVTPDGTTVWSQMEQGKRNNPQQLEKAREKARKNAIAQQEQFKPYCPSVELENAIAILVDDGIATGLTMMAAVEALRKQNPAQIWIAAPVAPPQIRDQFLQMCDRALILHTPDPFMSVGRFYQEFPQVSNEQVISYLKAPTH